MNIFEALTFINRNELRDIRLFRNDVERICDEAARVNFKDIFNYSDESFERTANIENGTLIICMILANRMLMVTLLLAFFTLLCLQVMNMMESFLLI
jgi:hypothetical protein